MPMQFQPKSAKEIAEMNLWEKGEYDFEIVKAEKAVSGPQSKSPGTEFIKLNVKIYNADGGFRFVNGILHPAMEAQLRHFCEVGGLMAKYEAGTLEFQDCVGVSGKLKLKIKDAEGNFPAKNEIADFVVPKEKRTAPAPEPQPAAPPDSDDTVPF